MDAEAPRVAPQPAGRCHGFAADDRRLPARARPAARPTRPDRGRARAARRLLAMDSDDRAIALLARDRHALRARAVRRDRPLRTLRASRQPVPLPWDRALGEHHRRATTPGLDHQGWLHSRPPVADRGLLPLPASPRDRPNARAPPTRPITRHRQHRLASAAQAERPLANAQARPQEAQRRGRGRDRPRTGRLLLGDRTRRLTISDNPWRLGAGGRPPPRPRPPARRAPAIGGCPPRATPGTPRAPPASRHHTPAAPTIKPTPPAINACPLTTHPPYEVVGWARVTDEAKRRRQELSVCRAAMPLSGPDLCALRCRARAHFSGWSSGLLVGDHPLVGHLGLLGQSAFGVTDRAVS